MVVRLFMFVNFLFLIGVVANAEEQVHPEIPGFQRFYAAPLAKLADEDDEPVQLDPVTGGRILIGELNCASCHVADSKLPLSKKQAPILDDVGTRVKLDWLRAYLAAPHAVKPGTTMPDLIATLPPADQAATVEALTHFLASTGTVSETRPDPIAGKNGASLFQKVGCAACHNAIDADSPKLANSVPLPDVGKKYSAPSLMEFLKDPLKVRPAGRMPSLSLTNDEARNLANYFVKEGVTTPNIKFVAYHGHFGNLPVFNKLTPAAEGEVGDFDLSVAGRENEYAIQFTSYLRTSISGDFQFFLGSDDGSRLTINDEVVINHDGSHGHHIKTGTKFLEPGFHKVLVEYFQDGGNFSLQVEIAGPGVNRRALSGLLYLEPKVPTSADGKPVFTVDNNLATRGRELFSKIGCASCHQLTIDGQAVASQLVAKPLSELTSNAGCLAPSVNGKAPRFGLDAVQRAAIANALKSWSDEKTTETIHRKLATMNCYACHQRDKIGGVEQARNASFESLQREMGDEGRLPPTLTGVGDKLRPEWLRRLLNDGTNHRKNYMVVRMPKFGGTNVESLVDQFAAVDVRPDAMPKAEFTDPEYRVKAAGRHLVGAQALSCIKCHDFGKHASTGIRAISLTTMSDRIRPDWFYRYVLDPQEYRRGTRMPAPWPFGKATIRDTLNGDVNLQIQAVMLYLKDGNRAGVPAGVIREMIELKPEGEPVIYRNFIEGAGSRAIGVGYQEGVNLAFDAHDLRMALIWHGAFIDASRHWTGRGEGYQPPLGDDVVPLPSQLPFVVIQQPNTDAPKEAQRNVDFKFLGYSLDAQKRPFFRYSVSGITIEDYPIPENVTGKVPTLKRILKFAGKGDTSHLWFRVAVGGTIEGTGQNYRIDNNLGIEIRENGLDKSIVREANGKKELLVPVRLQNGRCEISLHYIW